MSNKYINTWEIHFSLAMSVHMWLDTQKSVSLKQGSKFYHLVYWHYKSLYEFLSIYVMMLRKGTVYSWNDGHFSGVIITSDGLGFYTSESVYRAFNVTGGSRPLHDLVDQCSSKLIFL